MTITPFEFRWNDVWKMEGRGYYDEKQYVHVRRMPSERPYSFVMCELSEGSWHLSYQTQGYITHRSKVVRANLLDLFANPASYRAP